MFGRFKRFKSTIFSAEDAPELKMSASTIDVGNGIMVDPSCNTTITVDCLKQLYNATGFEGEGQGSIGITGYLEENVHPITNYRPKRFPDYYDPHRPTSRTLKLSSLNNVPMLLGRISLSFR
jgi:tripeptidyl-peptidase-1